MHGIVPRKMVPNLCLAAAIKNSLHSLAVLMIYFVAECLLLLLFLLKHLTFWSY